jgi:hypothetical protein
MGDGLRTNVMLEILTPQSSLADANKNVDVFDSERKMPFEFATGEAEERRDKPTQQPLVMTRVWKG